MSVWVVFFICEGDFGVLFVVFVKIVWIELIIVNFILCLLSFLMIVLMLVLDSKYSLFLL